MPTNKFVLRGALILPLLVIAAITHAQELALPFREPLSSPITYSETLSGYGFTTLNVAPVRRDTNADTAIPEDVNIFHFPLVGHIQDIGFRLATADGGKFDGLAQQAFFIDFRLPWAWSPWTNVSATPKLTLEAGRFNQGSENRFFASLGPTLRLANDRWRVPLFVDLGLSPTVIDGSTYGDRDFGTSFNFTSHIAVGLRFGQTKNHMVKLRYQHISNGSLDEVNPGVNMIGVDVVIWGR